MLQAIAMTNTAMTLCVNGREYAESDLPPEMLTDAELDEVRAIKPGALPGYVTIQPAEEGSADE